MWGVFWINVALVIVFLLILAVNWFWQGIKRARELEEQEQERPRCWLTPPLDHGDDDNYPRIGPIDTY